MRRARLIAAIAWSLSLCATGASVAAAATLAPVGTFDHPIYVTSDPGDPNRLFVTERGGVVKVTEGGEARTFADLSSLVSCCDGERGLLSIALAPDFASSGRFYAAYTGKEAAGGSEGDIHLDAFRHEGAALAREPILSIGHSTHSNHNGGQLQFGPDGYLYLSTGDGGDGGEAAQSLETLLGKLLRIEPRPGDAPPYAIPAGNPFAGTGGRDEIWAYGLRNPWRFSFDRAGGDLVIADVGEKAREEIDRAPSPATGRVGGAGANFGWNCREGTIAYPGAPSGCEGTGGFTEPVFDYPHEDPGDGGAHGCAITGGYVVRDPGLGDLYGSYVYGDFCVGQIRSIDLSAADPAETDRAEPGLSVPAFSLYSFGEDSCGRIYVVTGTGEVYRIVGDAPTDCPAPRTPSASKRKRKQPSISLRARAVGRHAGPGRRVRLTAHVKTCAPNRGRLLILKRGGRRLEAKKLNRRCFARFRALVRNRSTFRAVLPATRSVKAARSRRVTVRG